MKTRRLLGYCRLAVCVWLLPGICAAGERQEESANYFGFAEKRKGTLIGMIYDLKQNQQRQPTNVDPVKYPDIVKEFIDRNWDESILNRYFRSARPLYTTQVYIPHVSAGEAPKAFSVEDVMQPSCWVVHYKGQVSAPKAGTYRFLCYADDMVIVAVNGKVVCDGSRGDMQLTDRPRSKDRPMVSFQAGNGELEFGEWFEVRDGELMDLDILVGERPGGGFSAFVLFERQGEDYGKTASGLPQYPILQMAPAPLPTKGIAEYMIAPCAIPAKQTWTAYP